RATPLSQKEFEAKLLAFEKRLEELDDQQIIDGLTGLNFERRGDLVIVDVLEADGTWDQRRSMALEQQLGRMDRFSMLPGAPSAPRPTDKPREVKNGAAAPRPAPAPRPEPKGPPLALSELDGAIMIVFPPERFDLEVAAALGKRDWDQVVRSSDAMTGSMRDRMHRDGASWIAPLEFLSEVFVDGKPLTKPEFEKTAMLVDVAGGSMKALEVHFPRFGPVTLVELAGKGRFVISHQDAARAATLVK
ncbi:MAG: hypothetical protein NT062_33480, partial [Proteobacteria bacterium]|nr:hypothetical protein [Pseudomonadota bacterium]